MRWASLAGNPAIGCALTAGAGFDSPYWAALVFAAAIALARFGAALGGVAIWS